MHVPRVCLALMAMLVLLPTGSYGGKVVVNFYGESLCPYCVRFATKIVSAVFDSKVSELMEFTYVPWGNTRKDPTTGAVSCQHGPRECQLDTLISCVIETHPDQNEWYPVVDCIEKNAYTQPDVDKLKDACLPAGTSNKISACYTGDKGKALQEAAYNKTQALVPPHRWVPWVTVNGIPLYDDYPNLAAFVCAAAGDDASRPPACYDEPRAPALLGAPGKTLREASNTPQLHSGSATQLIAAHSANRKAGGAMGQAVVRD